MAGCIFCAIAEGKIPSKKVFEDELVVAFHDVAPQAPTHILVIPREHVESLAHTDSRHADLLLRLVTVVRDVAREAGLAQGYRVVTNISSDGGQTVPHLHWHVLGGRAMGWPPG